MGLKVQKYHKRWVDQGQDKVSSSTVNPKYGQGQDRSRREVLVTAPFLPSTPPPPQEVLNDIIFLTHFIFLSQVFSARLSMELFSCYGGAISSFPTKNRIGPITFMHVFYVRLCVLKIQRYGDKVTHPKEK